MRGALSSTTGREESMKGIESEREVIRKKGDANGWQHKI
jgi:hypothetical protein